MKTQEFYDMLANITEAFAWILAPRSFGSRLLQTRVPHNPRERS
jgi:hypothetical protein